MKRLIPLLALLAFLPQRGSAETVLGAHTYNHCLRD